MFEKLTRKAASSMNIVKDNIDKLKNELKAFTTKDTKPHEQGRQSSTTKYTKAHEHIWNIFSCFWCLSW